MEEVFLKYKECYTNNKCAKRRVYEVSNFGRIRVNGEIREPNCANGYYKIGHELLHRVVAELFVPNPDNKPEVDHINTDITDNRACNLRWVTSKENSNNPLTKKHYSEWQKGKHKYQHWRLENGKRKYY